MTRQRGEDTEGSVSAGRRGGTRGLEAAGELAEARGGRVRGENTHAASSASQRSIGINASCCEVGGLVVV